MALIHVGDLTYHSKLETFSNLFEENLRTCVNLDYGIWVDSKYTFSDNNVYQASVAKILIKVQIAS
jgi:hypothetical protein